MFILQGGRNDQLREGITAQAHTGERHHAGDKIFGHLARAGNSQPAAAEAADHVAFGKAVEGEDREIRAEGGGGDMLLAVHDQAVVDLIREEDKFLFPGDRHNLLQQFAGVQRASGVIGIDDEDGTGAGGDLPANVLDIGVPVGGFIAGVEHRLGPGDEGDIGPQGVAGTGEQDLITVIEQGGDGELSHLADAIADEDIIGGEALDALAGFVLQNGLTGGGHAAEIAVANGLIGILQQGVAHAGGHGKAEGGRIAGIEAQDGGSLRDHLHGLHIDGAADIGMDLGKFFGTDDGLHSKASLLWSNGK